jgi:hypothetical protein
VISNDPTGDKAYTPREDLGPAPGHEDEWWPDTGIPHRMRQTVARRAYKLGFDGVSEERVVGKRGKLTRLIRRHTDARSAWQRLQGGEEKKRLKRTIRGAPARAEAEAFNAHAADREADGYRAEAANVSRELERTRQAENALPRGHRGGRHAGKESVFAVASTGVLDGATFAFTIQALGGSLWLRILVAVALVLAYTTIVAVAGRTLAGLWNRLERASAKVLITLAVAAPVVLAVLAGDAFVLRGEFLTDAFKHLDAGIPANPQFLIPVQCATALAAALSVGWFHLGTDGYRLRKRVGELTATLTELQAKERTEHAVAVGCAKRAASIIAESAEAEADLPFVDSQVEHRIEEERGERDALIEIARLSWEEGQAARKLSEVPEPEPSQTFTDDLLKRVAELKEHTRAGDNGDVGVAS